LRVWTCGGFTVHGGVPHIGDQRVLAIRALALASISCRRGSLQEGDRSEIRTPRRFGCGNLECIKQGLDLFLLRDEPEFQKLVSREKPAWAAYAQ
jgi:hypothetical protein